MKVYFDQRLAFKSEAQSYTLGIQQRETEVGLYGNLSRFSVNSSKVELRSANLLSVLILLNLVLGLFTALNAQPLSPDLQKLGFSRPVFGMIPDSLFDWNSPQEAAYTVIFKGAHAWFSEDNRSILAHVDYHFRIKIHTEEGRKAAMVGIPYFAWKDTESISQLRAVSVHPKEGRNYLDTAQVRTIKVNDRVTFKEFDIPNAQPGAIIEYKYRLTRRYIEELPDFFLSQTQPTLQAQFILQNPPYLRYKAELKNTDRNMRQLTTRVDTSSADRIFTKRRAEPIQFDIWEMKDIPAMVEEPFITGLDDYRWNLVLRWSEFGIPRQVIETSWDLVSAELARERGLVPTLSSKDVQAKKISTLGSSRIDSLQRLYDLFDAVKSQVSFNNQPGLYLKRPVDTVLSKVPANRAEINLSLLAIIREAGFQAWPVLVTGVQRYESLTEYPSRYLFTDVLLAVKVSGKTILLDAAPKVSYPEFLPLDYISRKAMIFKGIKRYEWISLQNDYSMFNQELFANGTLDTEGTLTLNVKGVLRGYLASGFMDTYYKNGEMKEQLKAMLLSQYFESSMELIRIDTSKGAKEIRFETDIVLPNYTSRVEEGILFRPLPVGYLTQSPFSDNQRQLPVHFKAPEKIEVHLSLTLPPEYTFEKGAAAAKQRIPGASIQFESNAQRQKLSVVFLVELSQLSYSIDNFPQLRSIYENWVRLSSQEILIFPK